MNPLIPNEEAEKAARNKFKLIFIVVMIISFLIGWFLLSELVKYISL